jgi:hypothetical protein
MTPRVTHYPTGAFIGGAAVKLYRLEDARDEALMAAAKELGKVLGHTEKEFWTDTMPEAILAILDQHEQPACLAACKVFIEKTLHTEVDLCSANHNPSVAFGERPDTD